MALEFGGIDSKINDKADAYRNNPQQLQKRYGQNKQLVDLLALQKITAEKKEVAMNMALAAEGNPNTIADQRQQEALELTKKEMQGTLGELTGRTKDTLGQKQVEQQKGMQRIAKGAGKPPQGGLGALVGQGRPAAPPTNNPQMQGLAGARMAQAQQRGGPVRMAQGGIVSYAEGNLIKLSDAQKEKARRVFGPNADARIANIEALRDDDPAAAALLRLVEPAATPAGRAVENLGDSILGPTATLRAKVAGKYKPYANPIFGAFKEQSAAERAYAQEVMSNYGDLSAQQLQALLDAPFVGAGKTDMSAMPDVTTAAAVPAVETVPDILGGLNASASNITYERDDGAPSAFSQLSSELFNVQPTAAAEVSGEQVATAQADMVDSMGVMPEKIQVTDVKEAKLAPVYPATYLTPQQLEAQGALISASAADFNLDPQEAIDAARISADEYSLRAEKQETARQQLARQEALNAKRLDPARVEQLKRMETYGGGAKYGRGGIGQAYVESERRYDDIEEGGLNSLATLEQNAITNDFNLVNEGILAGGRAGTRTQADKIAARQIASDLVTEGRIMSTNQQTKNQGINTANAAAQNSVAIAEYKAEVEKNKNVNAAKREILRTEVQARVDLTRLSISEAEKQTATDVANAERTIQAALDSDKMVLERRKLDRLTFKDAQTIHQDQENRLWEEYGELINNDTVLIDLRGQVGNTDLSEAEYETLDKRIKLEEARLEARLVELFSFRFAKLRVLEERMLIASQGTANNPMGPLNPDDANVLVEPQ